MNVDTRSQMCEDVKNKYLKLAKTYDYSKENKSELQTLKNGVYTLRDSDGNVLYVGMVSNAKTANLYMRLYGNGNAAHCNKRWFSDVEQVTFFCLGTEEKMAVAVLERILIQELKPAHNDLEFNEEEIADLLDTMIG